MTSRSKLEADTRPRSFAAVTPGPHVPAQYPSIILRKQNLDRRNGEKQRDNSAHTITTDYCHTGFQHYTARLILPLPRKENGETEVPLSVYVIKTTVSRNAVYMIKPLLGSTDFQFVGTSEAFRQFWSRYVAANSSIAA